MRKKIAKKKAPISATTNLLVQMMNDMNSKLNHIHKDVEKNSKEDFEFSDDEIKLDIQQQRTS